jgi:OmpA-OmpF porin, OOP family
VAGDAANAVAKGTKAAVSATGHAVEKTAQVTADVAGKAAGTAVNLGEDKLAGASGLTRSVASTAAAFLLPRLMGKLTPNGVLPSTSALLSQVSGYLDRPTVSAIDDRPAVAPVPDREERRGWPAWLPWAAAAALALLALFWLRAPAGTIDPQLTLKNSDGKITYSGVVRDEATRTAIVSGLGKTFGEANVNGELRVDGNVKRASWLPHLGDIFSSLKTPGAELALDGDGVRIGGWLSAAERQALTDKLRGIFGTQATIGSLGDPVEEAVRAANDKALSALGAIGTSGANPDALVRAMNMAIINFQTGSAQITPDSMLVIRKCADAMKAAPAGAAIEIGGHTDNTGDPARNIELSRARAEAVKSALVSSGVPAAILITKGYGDSRPRTTNDTEYGRFQNRRIEYAVVR